MPYPGFRTPGDGFGLLVTLAGQDISPYVKEVPDPFGAGGTTMGIASANDILVIEDVLGQGAGVAQGSSGEPKTAKFKIADMGSIQSAIGGGVTPPTINLVDANQADQFNNVGASEFGTGSVTVSQDATTLWTGHPSLKCVSAGGGGFQYVEAQIPMSQFGNAKTYTFSVYMMASSGTPTVRFFAEGRGPGGANGAIGSTPTVTLSTTWTRYTVTMTMPNPIVNQFVNLRVDTGSPTTALTWWMNGLQVELGSVATPFHPPAPPALVRMGEVKIWDASGFQLFGGFAVKYSDCSYYPYVMVDVECHDYWEMLNRVVINEFYDGFTDVFIINDLLTKYATWVDRTVLPVTPSYTFSNLFLRNKTLQQALQQIADKSGYMIWVTADKKIHYALPESAAAAPFTLSDTYDLVTSFPYDFQKFDQDDTAIINRVTFYGGKRLSGDFTQDLSIQANSSNTTFVLAYYPHSANDGHIHVTLNGVDQALGFAAGDQALAANVLISQGGTAKVLLNSSAQTLTWDTAPASGATVTAKYRHEQPLIVQLKDDIAVAYFGQFLDGTISDSTVFDTATAILRCKTLLKEQKFGLTNITVRCWHGVGAQAGQIITVVNALRGLNANYIIQKVTTTALGNGQFYYDLDLGAWNWGLVHLVSLLARNASVDDTSDGDNTQPIKVESDSVSLLFSATATSVSRTMGAYDYRTSPVGDGHDAFFGLFSWG